VETVIVPLAIGETLYQISPKKLSLPELQRAPSVTGPSVVAPTVVKVRLLETDGIVVGLVAQLLTGAPATTGQE
jgi:hypothetical protein